MTETQWDKQLKINTTGRQDAHADQYHYPYEPTPYCVLQRLAESGYINKNSKLVDYGCGKGRVGFFLNHQTGCFATGIEYNEEIYNQAQENLKTYGRYLGITGKNHRQNSDQKTNRQTAKPNNTAKPNKTTEPKATTQQKNTIEFLCTNAETYQVQDADAFYFFNPFSVEILQSVIGKIVDSNYDNPREMYLFFYYPNDDYLAYLMTRPELMFVDEIDCQDLFQGKNERERILIFEVI